MSGALIDPVPWGTTAPTRNGSLNWVRMFSPFGLKLPVTWPAKEAEVTPMRRGSSSDRVLVMPLPKLAVKAATRQPPSPVSSVLVAK